jgi:hypothetical protein
MATLTLAELRALQTGDTIYAVIRYEDHDGSHSIYFAGRTTVTIYDYAGGERSYSPDARGELVFSDLDFADGAFTTDDWKCVFCLDAESARAELEAMKSDLQAFVDKQLAGLEVTFVD